MSEITKGGIIVPGQGKGIVGRPLPKPTLDEPMVPEEIKQWGAVVGWLRKKGYTPDQVRTLVSEAEEQAEDEEE